MKHWSKCGPYAVAKALSEQHGMDWIEAFRLAWCAMRMNEDPPQSVPAIEARISRVRHTPVVPESVLAMFQQHYRKVRFGNGSERYYY